MGTEAENANANLTQDGQNIAMSLSLLGSLPEGARNSLMKSAELQALTEITAKQESDGGSGSGEEAANKEEGKRQKAEGEQQPSLFFGKEKKGAEVKVPAFKTTEDMRSFVEKEFNVKDINEFFSKASEWRQSEGNVEKLQTEKKQLEDFIANLPDQLFNSMELFYTDPSSDKWKAALKQIDSKIDFSKSFDSNNEKDIIDHYFPGEISADDYADKDKNSIVKKAASLAKQNFERDSKAISENKKTISTQLENRSKLVTASVDKSINSMMKSYPGLGEGEVKKIQKMMLTGDYSSLFLHQDGTFSEEAAKNLAMALFGEQEIKRQASKKGTSEANKTKEDILNRGAQEVKEKNNGAGGGNESSASDGIKQNTGIMKMLGGYMKTRNTYSVTAEK